MPVSEWWQDTPLEQLNKEQWEALCDGCARCCLHKLEDQDSGQVYYTGIRCRYLDEQNCRCGDYPNRSTLVSHCIDLAGRDCSRLDWLPGTCAYRLRSLGKPLPDWHYLVCGDTEEVHRAGISIRGRALSDEYVHPDGYDEHIVHWVE